MKTLELNHQRRIHPLTWRRIHQQWMRLGIGPQRQTIVREPAREQRALDRLDSELWDMPVIVWL